MEHSQNDSSKSKAEKKHLTFKQWIKQPQVLVYLIVFLGALGILFQVSHIYTLNREVYELEQKLTEVEGEVDSKEGRLLSGADLKEVETQARALGMTEPATSQYVYDESATKNQKNSGKIPGIYEYLEAFRMIREEFIWPY